MHLHADGPVHACAGRRTSVMPLVNIASSPPLGSCCATEFAASDDADHGAPAHTSPSPPGRGEPLGVRDPSFSLREAWAPARGGPWTHSRCTALHAVAYCTALRWTTPRTLPGRPRGTVRLELARQAERLQRGTPGASRCLARARWRLTSSAPTPQARSRATSSRASCSASGVSLLRARRCARLV